VEFLERFLSHHARPPIRFERRLKGRGAPRRSARVRTEPEQAVLDVALPANAHRVQVGRVWSERPARRSHRNRPMGTDPMTPNLLAPKCRKARDLRTKPTATGFRTPAAARTSLEVHAPMLFLLRTGRNED
jgi:hypothetical protein